MSKVKGQRSKVKFGFTFLEVIVAIFIFSMVIATATAVFAKVVISYRRTKDVQRNMESAQQAMNLIAKSLRTSTVKVCLDSAGNLDSDCGSGMIGIIVYDYSQSECIKYGINTGAGNYYLYQKNITMSTHIGCTNSVVDLQTEKKLTENNKVNGRMNVVMSSKLGGLEKVGKVTLMLDVCTISGASCTTGNDKTSIQTTVSLRDYEESGI